jgi:two-component system response regulator MprA
MSEAQTQAGGARVLVIEDEPLVRETLAEMLSLGGHQVTLAADGDEGLRLYASGRHEIVFTDVFMPGASGWKVAQAIRGLGGRAAVVLVTGLGDSLDRSELEDSGVADVLPKPFEIDHVLGMVERLKRAAPR